MNDDILEMYKRNPELIKKFKEQSKNDAIYIELINDIINYYDDILKINEINEDYIYISKKIRCLALPIANYIWGMKHNDDFFSTMPLIMIIDEFKHKKSNLMDNLENYNILIDKLKK